MKKILPNATGAILLFFLAFAAAVSGQSLPPHEGFSFKLSEDKIEVVRGTEQSLTLTTVKAKSIAKNKVTLSASSTLPEGMSVRFSVNQQVFYSSIITIATTEQTPPGSYPVTFMCTIGSKSKSTLLHIEVK